MSGGLAPSKSTVYVSNLPFSLTNNDLHKIFEKYGKVVKVTIVKDKQWRSSKGVAFILFLERESANECVKALNGQDMFGRAIRCSIAKDNGRAPDFIRRKEYPDKSACYECGKEGHLSYSCPSNSLGERAPPPKKQRVRKKHQDGSSTNYQDYFDNSDEEARPERNSEETNEDQLQPDLETLSSAIQLEQVKQETDEWRHRIQVGDICDHAGQKEQSNRKRIRKDSYFSDEEISD